MIAKGSRSSTARVVNVITSSANQAQAIPSPLMRQRVRPNLELEDRGHSFRAAFRVERGSAA